MATATNYVLIKNDYWIIQCVFNGYGGPIIISKVSIFFLQIAVCSLFFSFQLSWSQDLIEDKSSSELTSEKQSPSENRGETSVRMTNIEWEPIEGAVSYELQLTPFDKEQKLRETLKFIEKKPVWKGELKPGKYQMKIRSRDRRGVPGEWSNSEEFYVKLYSPILKLPLQNQDLKSDEENESEVLFEWKKLRDASKYIVFIEDEGQTFKKQFETDKNQIKISLPVARRYFWYVKGIDQLGYEGEAEKEAFKFTLFGKKIETPFISVPETIYVRNLQWKNVRYADFYKINLYRRDKGRKWISIFENELKETTLIFDQNWEGGDYKLSVTATGALRGSSKTHSVIFPVAKGFRTAEAENIALLKKSIDRTEDWFFIASYLITQIQYQSENWDLLSKPKMSGWGGTGRLGLGYFNKQSPYGFLGIIDFSGIIIAQKVYQYPSAEIHGFLRWSSGKLGEIRGSSGFYYKEIPEIVGNKIEDFTVTPLKALGVHLGGEYWYPLTNKLGLQINGRFYIPLAGQSPNGNKVLNTPSMQYGVLGSMKINKVATGLLGYVYRVDNLKYPTKSSTSQTLGQSTNQSSIKGQYLNLYLEWDL